MTCGETEPVRRLPLRVTRMRVLPPKSKEVSISLNVRITTVSELLIVEGDDLKMGAD